MMKLFYCSLLLTLGLFAESPVKVIFDTDMYTDYDDIGALAMLHTLTDADKCDLLAVVQSTRGNAGLAVVEMVNRFYGREKLPVGALHAKGVNGPGAKGFGLLSKYRGWYRYEDSSKAPEATKVIRQTLAQQPDHSVVVCAVGYMTNLRNLLESPADNYSPLTGKELVAKKVKKAVIMACSYPKGREHNSEGDWQASKITFEEWPTPIVFSDYQYGRYVFAGRAVSELPDANNPVRDAFKNRLPPRSRVTNTSYDRIAGHPAWDETAILASVFNLEDYFNIERGTYRMVGTKGENIWLADEKSKDCRITEKLSKTEIGKVIDSWMIIPPKQGN